MQAWQQDRTRRLARPLLGMLLAAGAFPALAAPPAGSPAPEAPRAIRAGISTDTAPPPGLRDLFAAPAPGEAPPPAPGPAPAPGMANPFAVPLAPPAGQPASPPAAAEAGFAYPPDPAAARRAQEDFLARLRQNDANAAQALAPIFAQHDIGQIYQGITASYGIRPHDVADALTAYLVLAWMIATNTPEPDPRSLPMVRRQVATSLARDARMADPATRAALGEEFKILFVVLHGGWQAAAREGNAARYAEGAVAMFRQQAGLDPRSLVLDAQGFHRRG
ncbi:hypothetical protein BKE38_07240 [Pseudoroseomonas deserti]|uniref:Uncharacterized protein n=1 Tax=Teichococcus deserti TaxID=1817963 RepID=A0A1V2H5B8_9PROT|nr:hypothetical protein BKE38_07240 [Pseudoroseomonas deserti]